jgi:hypothetical protein
MKDRLAELDDLVAMAIDRIAYRASARPCLSSPSPLQSRYAVARYSAPPSANDTGTNRLSATAAAPAFAI